MEGKTSDAQEFQTLDTWNDLKFWERQTLEAGNAKPRTPRITLEVRNTKTWNVKPRKQARNVKPLMPGTQPRVLEKPNIGGWRHQTSETGDAKPQTLDADPSDNNPSDTDPLDADPLDTDPWTQKPSLLLLSASRVAANNN